ncbi:MAG: hypothetical protein IT563_04715 [Alphaproteobacteria bacterium]|nr:hypothetical protein [Alphaproteobacteria bacterium]
METFMRWAVALTALGLFILGAWLASTDKTASATAAFGAAMMCLIIVFLARFKTFQGFGIKAEMWDDTQREAAHLIKILRGYNAGLGKLFITLAARTGRWNSGLSNRELDDAVNSAEGMMRAAAVSPGEIEDAKAEYYRLTLIDMARPLNEAIGKCIDASLKIIAKELEQFPQPIQAADPAYATLIERWRRVHAERNSLREIHSAGAITGIADHLEQFLAKSEFINQADKARIPDEHRERLADIRAFAQEKRLRRPEIWFAEKDDE